MDLILTVELNAQARRKLLSEISEIQKKHNDFRWADEDELRIMLYTYKKTASPKEAVRQVQEAVFDISPFHLYVQEASLTLTKQITINLLFRRERSLETVVGRLSEDKFIPHLRLARYRVPSKQQYLLIKKHIHNLEIDVDFGVQNLTLMERRDTDNHTHYQAIAQIPLHRTM